MKNFINRALAAEKKLFIFLVAVLMSANMMAEGHLKFKGVEIDGTSQEFVEKLKEKGFTYLGQENSSDMLLGEFAGFKNCIIGVGKY